MVKKRRRHTAAYKFRIALEALEGSKAKSQLSSKHEIHASLIRSWTRYLLDDGPSIFYNHDRLHQIPDYLTRAEERFVL